MCFLHIKSLPNLLFGVLCLPRDQSHPFAQPTINPLARCICWAGLLGRAVFPPWNKGPNFGSYILHNLPVCAQTHVHWFSDAIQPSHSLPSPSPPTFNLSQHQGIFQWVGSSYQVTKYWHFSFRMICSNEYFGLISFKIDWNYLLPYQGKINVTAISDFWLPNVNEGS